MRATQTRNNNIAIAPFGHLLLLCCRCLWCLQTISKRTNRLLIVAYMSTEFHNNIALLFHLFARLDSEIRIEIDMCMRIEKTASAKFSEIIGATMYFTSSQIRYFARRSIPINIFISYTRRSHVPISLVITICAHPYLNCVRFDCWVFVCVCVLFFLNKQLNV